MFDLVRVQNAVCLYATSEAWVCFVGTSDECVWLCRRSPKYWWRLFRITHSYVRFVFAVSVSSWPAKESNSESAKRGRDREKDTLNYWLTELAYFFFIREERFRLKNPTIFQWDRIYNGFFCPLANLNIACRHCTVQCECIRYTVGLRTYVSVKNIFTTVRADSNVLSRWIDCFSSSSVWVLVMVKRKQNCSCHIRHSLQR